MIEHLDVCDCCDCLPVSTDPRPYRTWQCDTCGAEYDWLTYGGPCVTPTCDGELRRRAPRKQHD